MRRRPQAEPRPRGPLGVPVNPPGSSKPAPPSVSTAAALIEPFLVSGGQSYFRGFASDGGGSSTVAQNGTQLVCSVYVPKGRQGFIKEIRCAPYMPPVFADPWWTAGAAMGAASWRTFNDDTNAALIGDRPMRPAGQHGLWETPFGWENYASWSPGPDPEADPPQPPEPSVPTWTWTIRLLQGGVDALRQQATNLPPDPPESDAEDGFPDNTNPGAFFLLPDLAVPTGTIYPGGGLPGTTPGIAWGNNRMQALPGDPLHTHILIPEDTSACLFVQWTQQLCPVVARDQNGQIDYAGFSAYPLLPSCGSLHGYMQSSIDPKTLQNAQLGWGG